ncbi:uncharacterized protein LOC120218421 [Hibiscus syriacus]|uniref:uncharacterized protein LOC120218421 n=1 Tax=Hibiscus syriacus TaxID=106335 RepID=UPI001922E5F2|nr:uncharacterized protein LOC120218421 [Hibiscus syriacus]
MYSLSHKYIRHRRNIVDNTLLAQELVKGYGRKSISPRCSLKIDIHKAFDSLHWGFVLVVLKAIGLPTTFIKWVEACFTGAYVGIINVFEHFYAISGLKINAQKCKFYTAGISPRQIDEIKRITGFNQGYLPVRYPGVPLVTRKLSNKDCIALIDNIMEHLHQWSRRHLSYAELSSYVHVSFGKVRTRQLWELE